MKPVENKTIYLVRHGESSGNTAPIFQTPDSPLSDLGLQQSEHVAQRIAKISFDSLIVSPLRRARQTGEIIAQATGKEMEFGDLFVERKNPSRLDGKPYSDLTADMLWKQWENSYTSASQKIEDGESFDEITLRAKKALLFLENHPDESIVVVTHGYFLRILIAYALFANLLTPEIFREFHKHTATKNTGITVLQYQSGEPASWRLLVYNDHTHLG